MQDSSLQMRQSVGIFRVDLRKILSSCVAEVETGLHKKNQAKKGFKEGSD